MKKTLVGAAAVLCLGLVGCAFGYAPQDWDTPDAGKKLDSGKPDSGSYVYDSGSTPDDTWQPPLDSGSQCTLGISYGTASCDTCMQTSCCTADNACVGDSQCTALLTCLQSCADPTCYQNCENSNPQGATLFNAIGTCMQTSCANDCR